MTNQEGVLQFPSGAAPYLPPTVLMSSCSDTTVPFYESGELFYRLFDNEVPVKHLVYDKVGHGDFVVQWEDGLKATPPTSHAPEPHYPPEAEEADDSDDYEEDEETEASVREAQQGAGKAGSSQGGREVDEDELHLSRLPGYAADLARLVSGRVKVEYSARNDTQQAAVQHDAHGSNGAGVVPLNATAAASESDTKT
jgi:hypothetical protein